MHPHLHREDNKGCEEIMNALEECHAKGFMWKAIGMCSATKNEVNKCLRAERLERTAVNREEAKKKREHMKKVWAEIEANS
ncbi:unnamed protein product [Zymoseptoria tritici ST99CH_1A5]|uniref:COX assembly mitochondrial protein n=4 Tax=Zymoseptoria TaxID=1047167 RepID=A0A0F4G946_9PEZI|nr:cytochrome C oxidase biogenesis Cmc1-like protein [Zymoseptoria brevis]SMQ50853.1 unnamed protein product [Zymoseptoria tritici ST99CH_3D7]SMR52768.1 unnamed protein product [Zymoseptoria tritici ST99CH_1E4]SMR54086.1 unnamed protein product [Zymoseptoria tritici ST99CH_3D1]SMY24519.1 unnamed protein product [Zymoseptoria tritici ST99CH_1A5]